MGAKLLTAEEVLAMSEDDYMNEQQLAFFRHRLSEMEAQLRANADQTTVNLRETTVVPIRRPRDDRRRNTLELRTRDRERKLLKKVQAAIVPSTKATTATAKKRANPSASRRLMARPTATLSLGSAAAP